jgi:hypothetical protein
VRVVTPESAKDAREWVARGATWTDIAKRIETAPARHVTVTAGARKGV